MINADHPERSHNGTLRSWKALGTLIDERAPKRGGYDYSFVVTHPHAPIRCAQPGTRVTVHFAE